MQTKKSFLLIGLVALLLGTSGVLAQALTDCMECHEDTSLIKGKQVAWSQSVHGTGGAYVRGTRSSCAGCHSGGAFSAMVAAGLRPDQVEAGDIEPTRQDCRTCHQIHISGTTADWALETTAPVALYALDGMIYDGGTGNLCANCHQPRRIMAAPDGDGNVRVTSTHWGPHHGPQSAMMLGFGGAGDEHLALRGAASWHYKLIGDSCAGCHIGVDASHSFAALESSCAECHDEDFDPGKYQAEIQKLIDKLGARLEAKGMYHDGHPVVGSYPFYQAAALWNYIFIAVEDGSLGVHNPQYTKALLEAALVALQ